MSVKAFFFLQKKKKNSRMGKGVGNVNSLEYILKPGTVLFKIISYNKKISLNSILKAFKKIPGSFSLLKKN